MTVSLDSPLGARNSESRQRIKRTLNRAGGFVGKMARNPLTAIGGGIVLLLLIVAAFAPLIAPYNPLVQDLNNALVAPNAQHWFGTDEFGRDIFSRLVYGSRITLYIVLLVSVTVGPLGLLLGVTAGYFGGKVDAVLMRVTDIFISFPSLVLALAFVLEHPAVTSAIIGPRTMEQLETQLAAPDIVLDADVLDRIDGIVPPGTNLNADDGGWSPQVLAKSRLRRRSR